MINENRKVFQNSEKILEIKIKPEITPEILKTALQKNKIVEETATPAGLKYTRFREDFRHIERGTIIIGKRTIPGYPHIKRIFRFGEGLLHNLHSPYFFVEEKIDGFNARICKINGKIYAFSRGGILDSFMSEKARDPNRKFNLFFDKYPQMVLCAEVIGNTPHTIATATADEVTIFVFDIFDSDSGKYLDTAKKYALADKFGIITTPRLGRFKNENDGEFGSLKKLILSLNSRNGEGVVIRGEGVNGERGEILKFVTAQSDIADVAGTSSKFFDMPIGFFYQRILRSALFVHEFKLDRKRYANMLGQAFYEGLMSAFDSIANGKDISEDFKITMNEPTVWKDIVAKTSREVRLEKLSEEKLGGKKSDGKNSGDGKQKERTHVVFRRHYRKTSHNLRSFMGGKAVAD